MKHLTNLLLFLGIFAVVLRNILVYTVGAITPGYSPAINFISELSSEGTPYQDLMNWGSLIIFGAILTLTAYALHKRLRGPGLDLSMAYLAISGLAFIAIGFFPCPEGCRPEINSAQMTIHTLAGFIATISLSLSALVYGLGYLKKDRSNIRAISLGLGTFGALSFLGLWIIIVSYEFGIDIGLFDIKGILQRMNVASGDLWILLACVDGLSYQLNNEGSAVPHHTSSSLS